MGGMEMMLGNMLKSLGVNPEQIAGIATGLEQALKSLTEGQAKLMRQNDRILRHLGLETIQEEMTNGDPGNSDGIGAGGNPSDRGSGSSGGTDPGTGVV